MAAVRRIIKPGAALSLSDKLRIPLHRPRCPMFF